jgi:hypothetical protein
LSDETTIRWRGRGGGIGTPVVQAAANYGSSTAPLFYYAFDVMTLAGKDLTRIIIFVDKNIGHGATAEHG